MGSRESWVGYLSGRQRVLDQAADAINAAGPAPVAAGQQVTAPIVRLLRDQADEARKALHTLQAVPANATATLLQTLQQTRSQFPLSGPTAAWADLALPAELTRAASTVPACRSIGAPA